MCRWKVEAHKAQRVVVRQQFHVCSSTAHSLLKVDLVPGSTQGVHTSQDMNYHLPISVLWATYCTTNMSVLNVNGLSNLAAMA